MERCTYLVFVKAYPSGDSEQNSGCQPNGTSGVEHGPTGRKKSALSVTDGFG